MARAATALGDAADRDYLRFAQRTTITATAPIASNARVSGSLTGVGGCAFPAKAVIG
jgi:hypothetical protein